MITTVFKYLAEGFFLGLTLGTTCAATCGPMYMPYLMQRKQTVIKSIINILEISLGRFFSYIGFGILSGVIGGAMGIVLQRGWFVSVAYILFAVILLISTFRTHQKHKGCAVSKWSKFADRPFIFGVVTGVSLCPSFFGAMTAAFGAGADSGGETFTGAIAGASIFAGFFIGSTIFLMPFMIAGLAGNKRIFQKIAVIASVVVSAYFIGKGGMGLVNLVNESQRVSPTTAANVISAFDDTPLFIIDTTSGSDILRHAFDELRIGETVVVADTSQLTDSCIVFVAADYLEDPTLLRSSERFVVILPRNREFSDDQFAHQMVEYLQKYSFRKDEIHGTLFNMAEFLEKMNKSTEGSVQ
jgi:sulfite exporter TauE/SafE